MPLQLPTVWGATAAALAVGTIMVGGVLVASFTGPQFPMEDDLPVLPIGYAYGRQERGCGSGGCYLEAEVELPDGVTPAEGIVVLTGSTGCHARGLLDRRSQCSGLAPRGRDTLVVSVMLRDLGK